MSKNSCGNGMLRRQNALSTRCWRDTYDLAPGDHRGQQRCLSPAFNPLLKAVLARAYSMSSTRPQTLNAMDIRGLLHRMLCKEIPKSIMLLC
jgi:hypothetical protein